MSKSKIKVVELFAGVGGFRIGLEGYKGKSASSKFEKKIKSNFEVVWSNQYEPSTKIQHANLVYKNRWPKANHSENDIEKIIENDFDSILDHDLLVGGFPCQDYSVASILQRSKGLFGEKGVLWWSIYSIIKNKGPKKPKYLLLENVDRLLSSPAQQRGRDFAVMLSCLGEQGYGLEWRVINAADYGMPQRRRRIYILAYHKSTKLYEELKAKFDKNYILNNTLAMTFPVDFHKKPNLKEGKISTNKVNVSNNFNKESKINTFLNSGIFINGRYITFKTEPIYSGKSIFLRDIIIKKKVKDEYYINDKKYDKEIIKIQRDRINPSKHQTKKRKDIVIKSELDKWKYLKGTKNELRYNKKGKYFYNYDEGSMNFPEDLSKPSRTIITAESGKGASRTKHVIKVGKKYRRLTPVELERLNMFPDNHTKLNGILDSKRAFFMGNALVIGVIEKIGKVLQNLIINDSEK